MLTRSKLTAVCALTAGAALLPGRLAAEEPRGLVPISGSVRSPGPGATTLGGLSIVRTALTAGELSAPFSFSVSLRMRDFAGLEARVASGAQVQASELESRYLPLRSDYERVAAWLVSQGFTATLEDRSHMTVFVRGTAASVARTFGVCLARVAASDGEYTSAISEPAMPAGLAPLVLSVNGLQPEFRLRHLPAPAVATPMDIVGDGAFVTPDDIASAYNIPKTATGEGQTVAIVAMAPALTADLTTFWSVAGISQTMGNYQEVDVDGGAGADPSTSGTIEANLDTQWVSSVAPAADVRLYVATDALASVTQVLSDLPLYPNMRVLSISLGNTEGSDGPAVIQAYSQVLASLAASGVSVFASSGDCGSNPSNGAGAGSYLATAPLGVTYPASDPSVTAVGGTTVSFAANWQNAGEVAWNQLADEDDASGGGLSSFFPKPSWQTGNSVLAAQTMRCVPDVAALAIASLFDINQGPGYPPFSTTGIGALTYFGGTQLSLGGTSLSCPIWSGVAALINQGRATAGLGPVGFLNPKIYPLSGTKAFNDITSGTNGAYQAGTGYDLCTGLGSPNVANLISALGGMQAVSQRLSNISARVQVGTGSNIMIAGFSIQGPAGTAKDILVRGVGPGLSSFGVSGVLGSPTVSVYDTGSVPALIATNSGWGNPPTGGPSTVSASFRQATASDMSAAGAFTLAANSADSALVVTLPVGNYTVQVAGAGATSGVAIGEVYELNSSTPDTLANLSSRSFVGSGAQVAISGFVVTGNEPAKLLIRGIGPALTAFGVPGALAQPLLSVEDSLGTLVVSDAGWANAPVAGTSSVAATFRLATASDMQAAGAFSLAAGSTDSAIVATLPPGAYTAIVSGVGGGTGTGLAEVYEVP